MKSIKFSELALEDTIVIHDKLEEFKEGLGDRFYDHLAKPYEQIKTNNNSFKALGGGTQKRRAILKLTIILVNNPLPILRFPPIKIRQYRRHPSQWMPYQSMWLKETIRIT